MVFRKNSIKLSILLLLICMLSVSVNAVWWNPITWVGGDDPYEKYDVKGELADCVEAYNGNVDYCFENFCTFTEDLQVRCTYDGESNHLFVAEMYPSCDSIANYNKSEELTFLYNVDLNAQNFNDFPRSCGGDSGNALYTSTYKVPIDLINKHKSQLTWWEDFYGQHYPKSPTRGDLKDIYGNNIGSEVYSSLTEVPLRPESFSILSCNIDCDYQGTTDLDYDGVVCSNGQKNCIAQDFTKSTRYLNQGAGTSWYELLQETLETDCVDMGRNFILFGASTTISEDAANCIGANILLNTWDDEILGSKVYDSSLDQYMWDRYYSDVGQAAKSYTCSYPSDVYADVNGDINVTSRVTCTLSKSWESLIFSENFNEDVTWESLGLDHCDESKYTCAFHMYNSIFVNGTTGEQINQGSDVEGIIETDIEGVDRSNEIVRRNPNNFISDPTQIPTDYEIDLELDPIDGYVPKDINLNRVTQYMVDFGNNLFSFHIIIVYFLEGFIFIGVVKLLFDSMMTLRQSFKSLFGVEKR